MVATQGPGRAMLPWLMLVGVFPFVRSFSPATTTSYEHQHGSRLHHQRQQHYSSFATRLHMVNNPMALRKGITLPLLDIPDPPKGSNSNDDDDNDQTLVVLPLPSDHLPAALRDLNLYGMELRRPVHKLLLEDAKQRAKTGKAAAMMGLAEGETGKPLYGHLAWKPPASSASNNSSSTTSSSSSSNLVGAIGCVSEVILQADGANVATALMGSRDEKRSDIGALIAKTNEEKTAQDDDDDEVPNDEQNLPTTVVVCGSFRFIVKEVLQTVPFPIVVVDELLDKEPGSGPASAMDYNDFEDKFDDGDDNGDFDDDDAVGNELYQDMPTNEMMQDLFQTLRDYVELKLEEASNQQVSPLEQSILEETGLVDGINPAVAAQTRAEQIAATWISFQTSLIDFCPTPPEMYFAVAMMAAEVVDLGNPVRRKLLTMVDGVERLRYVLRHVKDTTGMARARKMAQQITDNNDESSKDLKVGTPGLPTWTRQITKGMKVAYYWNEEWQWCEAEVVEDPVMIVDELLVTLKFEDGEIHKLPFTPDEKVRWRPA